MLDYAALTHEKTPFYEISSSRKSETLYKNDFLKEVDFVENTPEWTYVNNTKIERGIGWKIHVSATIENSQEVLDKTSRVCLEINAPFKYIPSLDAFHARNAKYAELSSAGKFITIYPAPEIFDEISQRLRFVLASYNGPAIPMDIPSGDAPVYYRYGQFIDSSRVGVWGEVTAGSYRGDGVWVKDERQFVDISQIKDYIPRAVESAYERLRSNDEVLPFTPINILHRSNAGGVYEATYKGRRAVVKEARPHAGVDRLGNDAQFRLCNEWNAIVALDAVPGIVEGIDIIEFSEHTFLVEEYIPGDDLYTYAAKNYPFYGSASSTTYAKDVLLIIENAYETLVDVHNNGVYLNDVHARNIRVDNSNKPRFIDLESATYDEGESRHPVATPGTYLPTVLDGKNYDRTGLALTLLHMLHPSTPLSHRDPDVNKARVETIARVFGESVASSATGLLKEISPHIYNTVV